MWCSMKLLSNLSLDRPSFRDGPGNYSAHRPSNCRPSEMQTIYNCCKEVWPDCCSSSSTHEKGGVKSNRTPHLWPMSFGLFNSACRYSSFAETNYTDLCCYCSLLDCVWTANSQHRDTWTPSSMVEEATLLRLAAEIALTPEFAMLCTLALSLHKL